jgi:hypothetical protein
MVSFWLLASSPPGALLVFWRKDPGMTNFHLGLKIVLAERAATIAIEGPAAPAQIKRGTANCTAQSPPGKKPSPKSRGEKAFGAASSQLIRPTPGHFKWENGWPLLFFV